MMTPIDVIVIVAAVAAVVFTVVRAVLRKRQGKGGCCDSNGCADCPYCNSGDYKA